MREASDGCQMRFSATRMLLLVFASSKESRGLTTACAGLASLAGKAWG